MRRFVVRITTKTEQPYTVSADSVQDAMERVLGGEGEEGDPDYPEPDITVCELEG